MRMIKLPIKSTATETKKVEATREVAAVAVSEEAEEVAVATEVVLTDHKVIEATEDKIEMTSHTKMMKMMVTTTVNQFTTSPREEATRRKT